MDFHKGKIFKFGFLALGLLVSGARAAAGDAGTLTLDTLNLYINSIAAVGQAIGGIGAIVAVIVILFQKEIYNFIFKPRLKFVKHSESSKYTIEVMESYEVHRGAFQDDLKTKQKRIAVTIVNEGNAAAQNVRAYFTGLESNAVPDFDKYLSIPLPQSWTKKMSIDTLPEKMPVSWEVAFTESLWAEQIKFWFYELNDLQRITCKKGKDSYFIFRIDVLSDNTKEMSQKFRITYSGNYEKGVKFEFL